MRKIVSVFILLIAVSIAMLGIYFFDIPYLKEVVAFFFNGIITILNIKWNLFS